MALGCDNIISAHAIVRSGTVIGARNRIGSFAVIGCDPQSHHWKGDEIRLSIGDDNWIREHVTVSGGYSGDGTRIGSSNMLMAYAHVGHDSCLGSDIHLANGATLGDTLKYRTPPGSQGFAPSINPPGSAGSRSSRAERW